MLSGKGKFYKCTLVPVLSLILCLCLVGKSAEAATSATWLFNTGSGGGNIQSYATQSNPETYLVSSVASGPDLVINTYNFKFRYSVPVIVQFDQGAGADGNYRGGYINGFIRTNISLPVTVTGLTGTKANIRFDAQNALVQNDDVYTSIVGTVVSGDTLTVRIVTLFNNWSLPVVATTNRFLSLGEVIITYEFEAEEQPTNITTSVTPSVAIATNNMKCTATAAAGQGIAGQFYSAIENSTSIEDIINYLSLIEDAGGDINSAVSHINEQLLPSVISYMANIYTHTATMNVTTQQIRDYLYAISSTWPNYSSQVLFYLQQLLEMNQEQSSLAAEIESEYAAKASQGANLNSGMQVVIPSVDQGNFDINANVDSGTVTTLSAFWAMFPNNPLIGTLFAIAIAGIAAGFFLYGKKG